MQNISPMLDDRDAFYTDQWLVECSVLAQARVYHAARNLVPCRDGDIHVDLGCGSGAFLAGLWRKNTHTVLLGIERNREMIAKSMPIFHEVGASIRCYGKQETVQEMDGSMTTLFRHDELDDASSAEECLRPDGTIRILLDDIRTTTVLPRILRDRRIQSGSFLFPGVGLRVAYESPYLPDEVPGTEEHQRFIEIQRQTREAAVQFMAKYLDPGAPFVIAERFFTPPEQQEMAVSQGDIQDSLGSCVPYFDISPDVYVFRDIPASSPRSVSPIRHVDMRTGEEYDMRHLKKHAFIHRVVRNETPYVDF